MTGSGIRELHQASGAEFGTINGAEAVLTYGDDLAEHQALRTRVGVCDLSFRGRVCVTGNDRVGFLHGQVTNDVKNLKPGEGCYAAVVNAKGKIESDVNIYSLENELLLDFEPGLTASLTARFEKFVIADDVQIIDVAQHYGLLSVQGPQADAVVADLGIGLKIPDQPLSFSTVKDAEARELYCMRISRGAARGLDLFVPTVLLRSMAENLIASASRKGGRACGWRALETARIEAGIPRFGQDMDETNLAPEAIEQQAISYSKGCYIGQEVISRIRAYGQVAKALRGLRLEPSPEALPQKGDKIHVDEKEVGYVTSAVYSPILKASIALGYVRREHNSIGTELLIRCGEKNLAARIVPLPFVAE